MSDSAAHYRRSPLLLMHWQDSDVVLLHCDTRRRFRVDDRLVRLLSRLDGWTSIAELGAAGHAATAADLNRLVDLGVVEMSDDPAAGDGRNGHWNPFDLVVQRNTNTGGYWESRVEERGTAPPPLVKPRPAGPVIRLPIPSAALPGEFAEILHRRRSIRRYGERELRLDELSDLLHHSARIDRVLRHPGVGDQALRPFAAGGARSELEIYPVVNRVEGLAPGPHYYDPHTHELVRLGPGDAHQAELMRWLQLTTDGALNRDPAVVLLVTAVFARIMWKYEGIGLAVIYKNTGCLFQTLYLVSTALGLAPCAVGGGAELANSRWLGLDPLHESQVGCFLVGPGAGEAPEAAAGGDRRGVEMAPPGEPAAGARPIAPDLDRILRMSQGFLESAVLRSALELRVFDQLATGAAGAGAVAAALGIDGRGARLLLDALVALELVAREQGVYSLTPMAGSWLVAGRAGYLGGELKAYGQDMLWEAMRRLPDSVRQGGTVLDQDASTPGHGYWELLAEGVEASSGAAATALAEVLSDWTGARESLDVCDIACGNGAYGQAIALRHPRARVWSLDWPNVLPVARARARRLGLAERTSYLAGDMFDADLEGPYDLVILSHVLHHFARDRCVELLRRVAAVLRPDGRLAIQELAGDPVAPGRTASLFSIILLAWTREGEVHSLPAYAEMLAAAGFDAASVHAVPGQLARFLIAAPSSGPVTAFQ